MKPLTHTYVSCSRRCTIKEHSLSYKELAHLFIKPNTTAGSVLRTVMGATPARLQEISNALENWPVELFPLALLKNDYQFSRNTWYTVSASVRYTSINKHDSISD